ncbi:MAG: hypothetical protein ABGX16_19995 [Pirellulales bacterium]
MEKNEENVATEATTAPADDSSKKPFHVRAWIFCTMLVLALVGMGLTMSREDGGWEFWIFLLAFYAIVSLFWAWQRAKQKQESVWKMARTQVFHWFSVLLIFGILVLFERTEIISREASANVALLMLALACILAGIHFEWTFLLVGIVLGIMAISVSYLEQFFVWLVMLPVILATGWSYLKIRKRRA